MDGTRLARRALSRWPTAFHAARQGREWVRWRLGHVCDPDYQAIRLAPPGGTIVDVGANTGQSALSFSVLDPTAHIISFEPHPDLVPRLEAVKRRLGERFEFHSCALSSEPGEMLLHVPMVRGVEITGEASFDPEVAARAARRVPGITRTRSVSIPMRTLDSFARDPTVVKIDAQGMSMPVLGGMRDTLSRSRPLLIVESGDDDESVRSMLDGHGYRRVRWHSNANPRPLNWVYIP